MMFDAYSLSLRRARIARIAALFLLVGLASIIGIIGLATHPSGLAVHCGPRGCVDRTSLIELAPEDARPALEASRPAQAMFARHVDRLSVRLGLGAVLMIQGLPFAALMLAVGFALRRLAARKGDDLASAMPWLRRAAIAALLMAVAIPVGDSLEAMILFPGTPSGPMWYVEVDFRRLLFDLLLAFAAFAVVWVLDAGSRAERDVAAFV
jgi:hypothetical protein